jgi:hypothetical protein
VAHACIQVLRGLAEDALIYLRALGVAASREQGVRGFLQFTQLHQLLLTCHLAPIAISRDRKQGPCRNVQERWKVQYLAEFPLEVVVIYHATSNFAPGVRDCLHSVRATQRWTL